MFGNPFIPESAQEVGAGHCGRSGEWSPDCSQKSSHQPRSISPHSQFQKNEIVTPRIEHDGKCPRLEASEGEPHEASSV